MILLRGAPRRLATQRLATLRSAPQRYATQRNATFCNATQRNGLLTKELHYENRNS